MTLAFHVTPTANVAKIQREGLVPAVGPRSMSLGEPLPQCYFFVHDIGAVENAMMNWLGDAVDENESLSLLLVNLDGLDAQHSPGFDLELTTDRPVSPDRVLVLADDLDAFFGQAPERISAAVVEAQALLLKPAVSPVLPSPVQDLGDRACVAALRFFTNCDDFTDAQILSHWADLSACEEPDSVAPFLLWEPIERYSPASFIQVVEDAAACIERVGLAHADDFGRAGLIAALRVCCSDDLTDDQFVKHWAGWLNHSIGAKPELTRWQPFAAYADDEFAQLILDSADFFRAEMSRSFSAVSSLIQSPAEEASMALSDESKPLSLGALTLRPDLVGKFLAEDGKDFSDAEIERVFKGAVLEDFCVNSFKRSRDLGLTMADLERLNRCEETHLVVKFSTENAAFADGNRAMESARILQSAAERVEEIVLKGRGEVRGLFDINGNKVGSMVSDSEQPAGVGDNQTMVAIHLSGAAFAEDPARYARNLLLYAAERIEHQQFDFRLKDQNGNTVGRAILNGPASLVKDDQVNMQAALNERRVYLIEDSFDSINDGAHRFAVTVGDFEVGYGQGEGEVHVVNATGDVLTTESVREDGLIALTPAQKDQLLAVTEGRLTLEAHEALYSDLDGPSM